MFISCEICRRASRRPELCLKVQLQRPVFHMISLGKICGFNFFL